MPLLLLTAALAGRGGVRAARAQSLTDLAAPKEVGAFDLPDGFAQQLVAEGFTGATGMAVAPDGRVFVCEQTGALRVVKHDTLLPEPFLRLTDVDSEWERGLIGVTLDPDFARNGYVYICSVRAKPYPHHVVSRFTSDARNPDVAAAGGEVVLLEGDDQSTLGGSIPAGHQGGGVRFGADGKLYVAIGEQTAGDPAQRLDTLQGKLLRINPDGSIPPDNPFFKTAAGKYRAIWARGLRNPFGIAVQRATGRLFINDVGASRWEEINEGAPGANYGWPQSEGPTDDPNFRAPVHAYAEAATQSITGGTFYEPPDARAWQFPDRYVGKYFFADYVHNWVRMIDPNQPRVAETFAGALAGPVALEVAPDGCMYVLNRNVWVKDEKFKPNTGTLHRIFHVANATGRPAPVVTRPPVDATVADGAGATFAVRAVGAGPLQYQWLRNGKPVPGGDGPGVTLATTAPGDEGAVFRCVVSNAFGAAKSRPAVLHVTPLRAPDSPGAKLAGLSVAYYEGEWSRLPAFDALRPVRTGTVKALDSLEPPVARGWGLSLRGAVRIGRDGAYTIKLTSAGAAKLFVSGAEVASVGMTSGRRESSGTVGVKAGLHSIRIDIVAAKGKQELAVLYSGPGVSEGPMRASELFHADAATLPRGARPLATTLNLPRDPHDLPKLLSDAGVFRSTRDAELAPEPGVVGYDVNVPQWADGAMLRRWVALPGDASVALAGGPWRIPAGTVFVQHLDAPGPGAKPRRLETRVLVSDGAGRGYGALYRWRPDGTDADLETGPRTQDCAVCHNAEAGFVLGVNARQLNNGRDDLRTWARTGMFDREIPDRLIALSPRLAPLTDERAPLADRARSYLDANCAHCHRPGGVRAEFDARFETPLDRQNLIGARPVAGDLGVAGARIIAPGDRARSVLFQRITRRHDAFAMPPLDTRAVDSPAADVVGRWIDGLSAR
jgi:glucose/arabinose dehydrogenase